MTADTDRHVNSIDEDASPRRVPRASGRRTAALTIAALALGGAVGLASQPVATMVLCGAYLSGCFFARVERRWLWLTISPLAEFVGCPWPLAALCGWAAATRAWRTVPRPRWVRGWRLRRLAVATTAALACAAPAAAVTYQQFSAHPLVISMDRPAWPLVATVVLALSMLNASAEELLWRHALYELLRRAGLPLITVIGLVSASFGLAHLNGVPSGLAGILGAGLLGIVLCLLRLHLGLRYAVAAHVIIDVVVLGVLSTQTLWLAGS